MMDTIKKTITKAELSQSISAKMNGVLNERNISQAQLVKKLQDAGYSILQSDISKMLSCKAKVNLYFLAGFSEVTGVSMDELVSGTQSAAPLRLGGNSFQIDPAQSDGFQNIIGEYFVYFESTNRDEKTELISGKLIFREKEGFCEAVLFLEMAGSKRRLRKNYKGQLVLSRKMHAGYVFLYNENYGEISVLMFRYRDFITRRMECRLAMAVTMSAGESKKPTGHRLLLSRRRLDEKSCKAIAACLRIENNDILIDQDVLSLYFSENPDKREYVEPVIQAVRARNYYLIGDSDIRKAKRKISNQELLQLRKLLGEIAGERLPNVQISEQDDAEVFMLLDELLE